MGKLGGARAELLLRHRPDLRLRRRGRDRRAARRARIANGEFFAAGGRAASSETLESVTEEGHVFRVDLRLRPEGRVGRARPLARRLPRLPRRAGRAVGAPGAHQGARLRGGPSGGRALPRAGARRSSTAPALDRGHRRRDPRDEGRGSTESLRGEGSGAPQRQARRAAASARSSSSSRRSSSSTGATIRGCASGTACGPSSASPSAATSRPRSGAARRRARVPAHGRAPPADPPRVPDPHAARRSRTSSGSWRGAWASRGCRRRRRRGRFLRASTGRITARCTARSASSSPRRPRAAGAPPLRIPSYTALKATGFADPDRARQNLRLVLEGRPLVAVPGARRAARWTASSRCCSTRSGRARIPTRR